MKLRNNILIIVCLLLSAVPVVGWSQDISFDKISLPDEQLPGVITGITQDAKGNIWLSGSWNGSNNRGLSGLYQYDGFRMLFISHNDLSSTSLATGSVECVYGDTKGNIWAGTYGSGLEKFDPETGLFTHYQHDDKDPTSISGDSVTCIFEDHKGFLWVGTLFQGLNRLDPNTGKFKRYRHKDDDPNSLSFDEVRVIYEDKKGILWVGTGSAFIASENEGKRGGLNRLDEKRSSFKRYLHDDHDPHSLFDERVRAIFEDSYGNFWVGTAGDGLHTMDREKGTFERYRYDPSQPGKLSRPLVRNLYQYADDHITFITEDLQRAIWIGTFENGIVRYDPVTKTITHYSAGKGNFSDSTSWWEFTSRDGVMWMCTWDGNLYKLDPSHKNIGHADLQKRIFSLMEDSGKIWMGTDSGLLAVDKKTGGRVELIRGAPVSVFCKDRKNTIWVGTYGGGIWHLDPDRKGSTVYRHESGVNNSLADDEIFGLCADENSNLWIGTARGLDKMNIDNGEFEHFKIFPGDTIPFGKNLVNAIFEDTRRNLWVGNFYGGGLHVFDRRTHQNKNYLDRRSVNSIGEDHDGKIWVTTEEGLYYYEAKADSFVLFIDPSTASSIAAGSLVWDNNYNLWVSSNGGGGICRISPGSKQVLRFGRRYGINPVSLLQHAAFRGNDGQLFFGNYNGYYSFYPDELSSNATVPEIIITGFKIKDQQVQSSGGLSKSPGRVSEITLSHDQDVLSIQFNVIHYADPERNAALYMMENYDRDWRPAGSDRVAYYSNLPPGRYIFRIRAASSYGVWAEKDLRIVINPPWWRTWWAYCIYALLIAAAGYIIHHLQKQSVIRAERQKTKDRELAQAKEIEKAYHELKTTQSQLIQSEKMASLGELTAGIAHEIQNPLNFVNNFSEVNKELIHEASQANTSGNRNEVTELLSTLKDNEEKINHHGKRADAIVKGMLQHSRTGSGIKEPTDINKLADEYLRLAYQGFRARDKSFNATFSTEFDNGLDKMNIVPQEIGRVILNLINNAFYAVNEKSKQGAAGYEPTVIVGTRRLQDRVEISVKDNGNGIPASIKEKIFQPFFTTKPTGQGTGLGLSLAYDIVKAHGGEIRLETKDGEGSEFIIQL
jgi:signal transduction histidine kinase/ligand-binding sensor domain-containing protein